MARRKPIYVESRIRCSMDALWDSTQAPEEHRRWDLRFGDISYLQPTADKPQRFTYATTILPGVRVAGVGESLGDRDRPDGTRWSGLKFWSKDWRSLIEAGAGYWRYVPADDGIRFLTRYDYRTRWGKPGETFDRFVFRPAFGWATAWSFDRLRLWLEKDITPERSRNQAVAHATAVAATAAVWIFHGAVPKWLKPDADEVALVRRAGIPARQARQVVRLMGVGEIAMGLWMATQPRSRAPFVTSAAAISALTLGAWRADSRLFTKAFNPTSINTAVFALCVVAVCTRDDLPSGRTPLRAAPDVQPRVGPLPGEKA